MAKYNTNVNTSNNISKEDIEHYSDQMKELKLIIGDLNAHHPLWESKWNSKLIKKGKVYWTF